MKLALCAVALLWIATRLDRAAAKAEREEWERLR